MQVASWDSLATDRQTNIVKPCDRPSNSRQIKKQTLEYTNNSKISYFYLLLRETGGGDWNAWRLELCDERGVEWNPRLRPLLVDSAFSLSDPLSTDRRRMGERFFLSLRRIRPASARQRSSSSDLREKFLPHGLVMSLLVNGWLVSQKLTAKCDGRCGVVKVFKEAYWPPPRGKFLK